MAYSNFIRGNGLGSIQRFQRYLTSANWTNGQNVGFVGARAFKTEVTKLPKTLMTPRTTSVSNNTTFYRFYFFLKIILGAIIDAQGGRRKIGGSWPPNISKNKSGLATSIQKQ